MKRPLLFCLAALTLAGCKTNPLSVLVSPRVTGRVLAADTHQPVAGVKVITARQAAANATEPPKGGQLLTAQAPVQTDEQGRFTLTAERVLTPFGGAGWFSVDLLFEHPGYERYRTNYSYANLGTNTLNGERVLDAGTILLQPAAQ
jgi:hypothetical protein